MRKTGTASFRVLASVMICLLLPAREAVAMQDTRQAAARLKQVVIDLGVGTEVVVKLGRASPIRGEIRTIVDSGFAMQAQGERKFVDYRAISELKLPTMKYKAGSSPDTAALRRIVWVVGVGRDVVVKPDGKDKFRARIQAIETSGFSVSRVKGEIIELDFSVVNELEPSGSRAAKAGSIAAAVGLATLLLILAVANSLANS